MSEPLLRLTIFMAVLLLLLSWESLRPQRPWQQPRGRHLRTNIGLLLVDVLVQRFTLGAAAIAAAVYARQQGWGLLPLLPLPAPLLAVVGIILLDLAIYGQHVLSHRLRWLWRLHRVHHSDLDLAGVFELAFDAACDVAREPDRLIVGDAVALDHDADLAARLEREASGHALERLCDALEPLKALDVGLQQIPPRAGARR